VYNRLEQYGEAVPLLQSCATHIPFVWGVWEEALLNEPAATRLYEDFIKSTEAPTAGDQEACLFPSFARHFAILCLKQQGKNAAALSLLEKLNPAGKFSLLQRGELLEPEAAVPLLDTLVRLFPGALDGLDTFSNVLFMVGDKIKLKWLAAYALEIDSHAWQTQFILGNLAALDGHHGDALQAFTKSVLLKPDAATWTLIGHTLLELKAYQKALLAYQHALAVSHQHEVPAHRWEYIGFILSL
jgi:tetratricopeptide (TPR) repeat protein